jgi:hypothetical protein
MRGSGTIGTNRGKIHHKIANRIVEVSPLLTWQIVESSFSRIIRIRK